MLEKKERAGGRAFACHRMADLSSESQWRASAQETPGASSADVHERAQGWDRLVVIFGLWVAVALAYWPSAVALNGFWTDTVNNAYTHGYLVLLISLWLVVRDRRRLFAAPLKPEPRVLWLVAAFSLLWVYCYGAAIQDPQLLLLPLLLFAAIVASLGRRLARVLYFPIGFLYFAMPAWSDISRTLQWMSIQANDFLVSMWGIPAYLTGKYIHLPGGVLEIANGCSGLHFFVVGLALAALYGELAGDSTRRRLFWLALMGVFAIVGNWIRIFVVVAAGYETDMKSYLITVSHYWFGWGVFVVFFIVFLWLAGLLAKRWDRHSPVASAGTSHSPAPEARRVPAAVRVGPALAALAALVILPAVVYGSDLVQPIASQGVAIVWPPAPVGWQGPQRVGYSVWRPVYLAPTARSFRRYVSPAGHRVELYTVAYRRQTQAGKLLGYWNKLLGAKGQLRLVSSHIVTRSSGPWREQTVLDAAGIRSLIWSRYAIGSKDFADGRRSQLWYGIAAFTSRPVSSLTALRAVCRPDCAAARARLDAAAAKLLPAVHAEVNHE